VRLSVCDLVRMLAQSLCPELLPKRTVVGHAQQVMTPRCRAEQRRMAPRTRSPLRIRNTDGRAGTVCGRSAPSWQGTKNRSWRGGSESREFGQCVEEGGFGVWSEMFDSPRVR